jgi:translation initiation factor 2B subunit (eIF-2B alpha/beta/delta family)
VQLTCGKGGLGAAGIVGTSDLHRAGEATETPLGEVKGRLTVVAPRRPLVAGDDDGAVFGGHSHGLRVDAREVEDDFDPILRFEDVHRRAVARALTRRELAVEPAKPPPQILAGVTKVEKDARHSNAYSSKPCASAAGKVGRRTLEERYRTTVDAIRADASSSATDILMRAADLLLELTRRAGERGDLSDLASACARAQPTMAGLLTLEAVVRDASDPAAAIDRFQRQIRRAPSAIARHAATVLLLRPEPPPPGRPVLRLVTCSSSRAVEAALLAVARDADVTVACAESRPKREGVEIAGRLAGAGIGVELFSDAGLSASVPGSDAVLVGADAVGPDFFINKVGTAALCALANAVGVPVYALAGREKLLSRADVARLVIIEGPPAELIDDAPPSGVIVRNPYFERIPLSLLSLLITDAGPRDPGSI